MQTPGMQTPGRRWPMIGPPTDAAINPSGYGRAHPPATAEPPHTSADSSDGMKCHARGDRPCIDDVCHSQGSCAWAPEVIEHMTVRESGMFRELERIAERNEGRDTAGGAR